jgi:hypothetical protein
MKYIEELSSGFFFLYNNESFLLTTDFRENSTTKKYMCVNIVTGMSSWIDAETSVEILDLYKRDDEGNILPIKEHKDDYKKFT